MILHRRTPPFNYFWNNGSTTSSINGLTAGDYINSITDANGCISSPATDTLTVSEPTILQSSISITNHATCAGAQTLATGELNVTVSGGSPGYSYSWSNGETSNQLSFLMPDLYVLNVTDNNGCLLTDSAEILPGQNPQLDVLVQNVSCFGANDGMIYTLLLVEHYHINIVLMGVILLYPQVHLWSIWSSILFHNRC